MSNPAHKRALIAVRLSASRDQSTSPERQRDHCRQKIKQNAWTEAGVAEDLAVSATKYSPFQRPELGDWLHNRRDEFDTIVFWRFDRIARSSADMAALVEWCREHGKQLVSATEPFDMTDPFGEAMVTIIVALGQLEARTTKLRVADAHAKLRQTDRWASGVPPLGYLPVPHPSGKGVGLAIDSEAKELLHAMAQKLVNGWSFTRIAQWCNDNGALTAMDRARVRSGQEPARAPWTVNNVIRVLTSPATQGFKVHARGTGKRVDPVLDSQGNLIRMAEPLFDDETWELMQEAAAERQQSGKRRVHSANPMLGVGRCGAVVHANDCPHAPTDYSNVYGGRGSVEQAKQDPPCVATGTCYRCNASLAQQFSKSRLSDGTERINRTYRCGRTPINCRRVSANADDVDRVMDALFLAAYRDRYVQETVFVPGTDNRTEIEQTKQAIARLRWESDNGLVDDETEWMQRMKALADKLRELEAEPYRPSRWKTVETDQTYGEVWPTLDMEGKRRLLQDAQAGLVLYHRSGKEPVMEVEIDGAAHLSGATSSPPSEPS